MEFLFELLSFAYADLMHVTIISGDWAVYYLVGYFMFCAFIRIDLRGWNFQYLISVPAEERVGYHSGVFFPLQNWFLA